MPVLMVTLVSVIVVGVLLFQVARSSDQRSRAQTAADAAALAGARAIRSQLESIAAVGTVGEISIGGDAARAAADDYANRNGARVIDFERLGVDVRVEVQTTDKLGDQAAAVDAEEVQGSAKARATYRVVSSVGELPADAAGAPSGDGRVSDDEWSELEQRLGDLDPPEDVIALGRMLEEHGFHIGGNAAFGAVDGYPAGGSHRQHDGRGAIDVNFGCRCGDLYPPEVAAIEPLIPKIRALGFNTLWNIAPGDHQDHLHVDVGSPGALTGPGIGGRLGRTDDVVVELRLVPP